MKDVLGNEVDDRDVNEFETSAEDVSDDLEDVLRQVDDGDEVVIDPDEAGLSRADKKKLRGEKLREERLARERQLEQDRAEVEKRQALLEQRIQFLEQERRVPTQAPDDTDHDEIDRIYEEQSRLYDAYNAKAEAKTLTAEDAAAFKRDARALQTKLVQTAVQRELKSQPQPNVGEQATRMQLQMQYPEVLGDTRASAYAQGLFLTKVALGEPNNMETVHKTMRETMQTLKLGGASDQNDEDLRRKLVGVPRGGVPKGQTKGNSIKITKDIVVMANKTFPNLPTEKARLDHWIKTVGPAYLKEQNNEAD